MDQNGGMIMDTKINPEWPKVPDTIKYRCGYDVIVLSDLRWEIQFEPNWANGGVGKKFYTMLTGQRADGPRQVVYGVTQEELTAGSITRTTGG